jgi:hypothetical protein
MPQPTEPQAPDKVAGRSRELVVLRAARLDQTIQTVRRYSYSPPNRPT